MKEGKHNLRLEWNPRTNTYVLMDMALEDANILMSFHTDTGRIFTYSGIDTDCIWELNKDQKIKIEIA